MTPILPPSRALPVLLLLCGVVQSGCAYRITSRGVEGVLTELGPEGRSGGVEPIAEHILEKELIYRLGAQMGKGLKEGAADITPEQQAQLEATIDALLDVTAKKTGAGIRNEISPELRAMVRRDITMAFSDGLRNEMGDSAEDVVRRVVHATGDSLKDTFQDPQMQLALAELLRESIYIAMREDDHLTPGVGETLRTTIEGDMLNPVERSAQEISSTFGVMVNEANKESQETLETIIYGLLALIGALGMVLFFRGRQLSRQTEAAREAQQNLGAVQAAVRLLDKDTPPPDPRQGQRVPQGSGRPCQPHPHHGRRPRAPLRPVRAQAQAVGSYGVAAALRKVHFTGPSTRSTFTAW